MISLISPALIMIDSSFPLFSHLLQAFADAGELAVQAAVDDVGTDLGHESAEEGVVHVLFDDHLSGAGDAGQPRPQRISLRVGERYAGTYLCAHPPEICVDHFSEGLRDRVEVLRSTRASHEADEVAHER